MKIVFTGAPCTGKTSTIESLRNKRNKNIYIPEIASFVKMTKAHNYIDSEIFQEFIYKLQKDLENLVLPSIDYIEHIFFDRGTLDSLAFCRKLSNPKYNIVINEEYQRYDIVFFLMLPKSNTLYERYFSSNPQRDENYHEAFLIQNSLYEIWKDHPRFFPIEFHRDFNEKIASIAKKIEEIKMS